MIFFIFISIMLIELSVSSFNFSFMSANMNVLKKVKQKFQKSGSYCVGKDDFNDVRKDQSAMKYMIQMICTKIDRSEALNHIETKYGRAIKQLGSGSFGKVYAFQIKGDSNNPITAAIKVPKVFKYEDLFIELNASECIKESMDNKTLENYGVIKECVWIPNTNPYMIMQYYKYTFAKKIKSYYKKHWDNMDNECKTKALNDMIKLTQELLVLHKKGIAHRDLKPENIMIDEKKNPVLVDFGLATTVGQKKSKSLKGTPFYVDYEIMNQNGSPITSDIYSLCIIFAEIYLGKGGDKIIGGMTDGNKKYNPDFKDLKTPNDFKWTENMFKHAYGFTTLVNGDRWTAQDVLDELYKMLNVINSQRII